MKRRVQERGELDWSAEDLIELQSQPFEAIDAIYSVFGNIVVSGCNVVNNTIGFGVVILDGKIMPFDGSTVEAFPCYLSAQITPVNARYVDGLLKPVSYEYKATILTAKPANKGYITVTNSGTDKLIKRSSDLINSNDTQTVATSKAVKIVADELGKKADSSHTHNYEPTFTKKSAFNKDFGSLAENVCQGNDSRLSDARPASDVSQWAKESTKPSYSASEVGAASTYHSHSDYESAFSKNSAFNKNFGSSAGTVCEGDDSRLSDARAASDVSQWAKAATKPSYTASEVGAAKTDLSNVTLYKSLLSNGYYKAPDGLMIQWGYSSSASSQFSLSFPTSFLNVYSVTASILSSGTSSTNSIITIIVSNILTSGFSVCKRYINSIKTFGSATESFYWIAVGTWK